MLDYCFETCLSQVLTKVSGLRKVQTSPMTLSSLHQITVDHLEHSFSSQDKADSMHSLAESESDSTLCMADNMLTIESLRMHLNSCFSCGVSWQDDHVSLDCSECGGYSLTRPCPICEGKCGQQWKRDLATSHSLAKANWNGNCGLAKQQPSSEADLLSHRFHTLRTAS